jgi:hypothetical protein
VCDGVCGPKMVGKRSECMNLLTSTKCRDPIADVEVVHDQRSQRGGVPCGLG